MREAKLQRVTKYYNSEEGMTARKLKNRLAKEEAKEQEERYQKPVLDMTITIEWKRSNVWGMNPHAEVQVHYGDGSYTRREGYTCSGCGYDKESTVIAQIFNAFLKYKLWEREDMDNSGAPYGIRLDFDWSPSYEGGVGASCYYDISKFLGGEFKRISSGKTFDVYTLTMIK